MNIFLFLSERSVRILAFASKQKAPEPGIVINSTPPSITLLFVIAAQALALRFFAGLIEATAPYFNTSTSLVKDVLAKEYSPETPK